MKIKKSLPVVLVFFWPMIINAQPAPVVTNKIQDRFIPAVYSNQDNAGYLQDIMMINHRRRLMQLDIESILVPYRNRPGVQEWTGEHVGKFLHAAVLECLNNPDTALRNRIDYAAKSLIATQMFDGYLGTYLEKDRWTSWDVWSHKYNLIGLLAYYKMSGYKPALTACERMADLICRTFGKNTRDIIRSGTHMGLAPASILEPMVDLYRYSGKKAYLDFCGYIIDAWEEQGGPKILSSLLQGGNVFKTADSKAYEMLSNLVGLLEMYRLTGYEPYFKAVSNAWEDIVSKRLYIHGTASHTEDFQDDFDLNPGGYYDKGAKYGGPGEGCVTVTWLQMNLQLLRLTADQKYAQQLELTTYNALIAAQNPHNGQVCYFLPLQGRKRYGEVTHGILPDVCCCASSIPRGIAMIPQFIAGSIGNYPGLLLYSSGTYRTNGEIGHDKNGITLDVKTDFPVSGNVSIKIASSLNKPYPIYLNVPAWTDSFTATINGETYRGRPGTLLPITRAWKNGDSIALNIGLPLKLIADNNRNSKLVAVNRGPQILATDENVNDAQGLPAWGWHGRQLYHFYAEGPAGRKDMLMVPLADAGQSMADYKVLLDSFKIVNTDIPLPLQKYHAQLEALRTEFRTVKMPDIHFFLFGMGNRTKLLYVNGNLSNAVTGEILGTWDLRNETIVPNEYEVDLKTTAGVMVRIYENEKGVFLNTAGADRLIDGTAAPLILPSFGDSKYGEILKVLHNEILVNIIDGKPVPNFLVYKKPWRRDGAMMAMCLAKTGNTGLIKNWVMGLTDIYDRNNAGEKEADNLGQTLYLLSLFTDKSNSLVQRILSELVKYEVTDGNGRYIRGRSDFHEAPVYQTKWLKFGLKSLDLPDPYSIPSVKDNYASLFWWEYQSTYLKETMDAYDQWKNDHYPYIGWAADHFHRLKRSPLSNRDYPLTWEINASQADYKGMAIVNSEYVVQKNASPHTWHAAEMFLYLLDLR